LVSSTVKSKSEGERFLIISSAPIRLRLVPEQGLIIKRAFFLFIQHIRFKLLGVSLFPNYNRWEGLGQEKVFSVRAGKPNIYAVIRLFLPEIILLR
jgi:hypothetical protein